MSKIRVWRKATVLVLVFAMLFSQTIFADSIQDAQDQKDSLESKKAEMEQSIKDLEKDKSDIVAYIEKLDEKLNDLNSQITELEGNIETVNADLKTTEAQLKEAKETEQNQYDTMKKRIKYIYENGSQGYLEIIFGSKSFGDLLNRVEYINKIQKYDDNLLDEYKKTKELVASKKEEQEEKEAELTEMKNELSVEQDGVEELVDKKTEQLKEKQAEITSSQSQVSDYESEIKEQEDLLEQLLEAERIKQEEELKAKQEAEAKQKAEEEQKSNAEQSSDTAQSGSSDSENNNTANTGSTFRWPLNVSGTITSPFGYRSAPTAGASTYHQGIDIATPVGTDVYAASGGTVTTASYQAAAGNYIMIYHGNSIYTVYMHLSKISVSTGEEVTQGELIGYSGSTGISTGPHLHFGVNVNGSYVNPLNYVSQP